jgi:hypothetical protein
MSIEQLKTELREFIALSEKLGSTTWTLEEKDWGWELSAEKYFADLHKLTNEPEEVAEARASFIARSRNISPTMAKMLLCAVEGLERLYDDTEGYADGAPDASGHDRLCNEVSHVAKHQLQQLLKLWEETK